MMPEGFTSYFEIEAAGQRIGIMSCKTCGAAIVLGDKDFDAAHAHENWHEEQSR